MRTSIVLLLGGANCVYKDAEIANQLFTPDAIAAVNNIAITWPHVDFLFTVHVRPTKNWPGVIEALKQREKLGLNKPIVYSHKKVEGVDRTTKWHHGSSGQLATTGLIELGYKVVLAGIPTDASPHFFDDKPWRAFKTYQKSWKKLERIKPYVRSMSGWTKEFFGEPDMAWLKEDVTPNIS